MFIVRAILRETKIDGIDFWNGEPGKEYLIDLDRKTRAHWEHLEAGKQRDLVMVADAVDGGWIPLELLDIQV